MSISQNEVPDREFKTKTASGFLSLIWLALALFIASAGAYGSEKVTLSWDPSIDTDVTGYIVHYGTNTSNYHWSLDVGKVTTATVEGLAEGNTYYFAVTAYNSSKLESLPSNEVSYTTSTAVSPALSSTEASSTPAEEQLAPVTATIKTARSADYPAMNFTTADGSLALGIESMQITESGLFQINIIGQTGVRCEIQASIDYRTWLPLGNVVLAENRGRFIDFHSSEHPLRFYRLAELP